ncbi:tetratricopeptide repeat protein [Neptunomonas japonica]|uniref:Tetratricopeptide repeat protein 38 n=1 Tax=Neptunomonas japonica JAMM 1380 TaxID=1441457 RepID=A0A7R6PL86_9GAMM|nr:tetratricopeptide repeat protein [Neptunomonas japonica]BBB31191.1 conserved hypothetical protein [Neptunomonas japonica JAMM 1380]
MKDLTNLDVTVHSQQALDLYNIAVAELCHFKNPVPTTIKMLEVESSFVMGQVFNGHINLWATDKDDLQWTQQSLQAIANVNPAQLNHRERMHIAALTTWAKGDLRGASQQLDQILIEYPLDIMALLSGHQLDFFLGDALNLLDRVCRVLPEWDKEHPLYGFLLGMLSFGQEETGRYELAEQTALEAVTINPKDIWGIHAVAHSREMQSKFNEGASFMREYEKHWSQDNVMISHNAIHQGLYLLETGELAEAVDLYDKYVHWTGIEPIPMALVDASSVLWRLHLEGVELGNRAYELSDSWQKKDDQLFYAFNDAHAMLAYAASGNDNAAQTLLNKMKDYALQGDSNVTNHAMVVQTGLPTCEAFYAFGKGDYQTAANKLWAIKNTNAQFGGSHAQRDVLARTLLEAAIRSDNKTLAQAVINERLMARPQSPYNLSKLEKIRAMN